MKRIKSIAWIDGEGVGERFWDDGFEQDEYIKEVKDDLFHIGQSYENQACKTLYCCKCNSNKFHVGSGSFFTAIKCINCGWEICVHEG